MIRNVDSNFEMSFQRSGGSIITARVDIWRAEQEQWQHVAELVFDNPVLPTEKRGAELKAGRYTCVFKCRVEESLNGRYGFDLAVNDKSTFADTGDVNTTSSQHDSKVYRDQFVLAVDPQGMFT
jgi:hypothetical protein